MKPIIGITMGDPAGIGPEVIVKALTDNSMFLPFHPLLIGKTDVIKQTIDDLGVALKISKIENQEKLEFAQDVVTVLDTCNSVLEFELGTTNKTCGEHAFQAVVESVRLCQTGLIDAVVTAPICKESWHLAGHKFDGHTGLLAHLTKTKDYRMMFVAEPFSVVLVTTHIPLREVGDSLSVKSIFKTIELGFLELKKLGLKKPKIAICGLNPHAGENGIFGHEDRDIIMPAVKQAQNTGIDASGPFPADTIFLRALNGDFDMVIALYHDQGLIPVKLLAFENAVNLTIGLPIVRTSVDHGTAFDIASQRKANHNNMVCAIKYAYQLRSKTIDT